jgi:hypothetical protein
LQLSYNALQLLLGEGNARWKIKPAFAEMIRNGRMECLKESHFPEDRLLVDRPEERASANATFG